MTEGPRLRLLVFPLAGKRWAVSLVGVDEILRAPRLHPVPTPRERCAGLTLHDGRALAALVLEGPVETDYPYGIVVGDRNGAVVLLAEEAGELTTSDADGLEPHDDGVIRGALQDAAGRVLLLDHRRLIRRGLD